MTIRLPKYGIGDIIAFDGTAGERASNILTHAWEEVDNPTDEKAWASLFKTPRPDFLSRCSKCKAVKTMSASAEWPCGKPRRAETAIW